MPNDAPSFGAGTGFVTTDFGSNDLGYHVSEMADGKIVVTGYANGQLGISRFNADGTPDTAFGGGDGKAVLVPPAGLGIPGGSFNDSIVVDDFGNIWAAAISGSGAPSSQSALIKYGSDGQLDTTFGSGAGYVTTDLPGTHDGGRSINIDANGKLLVGGSTIVDSTRNFAVIRYDTNGNLDSTFGTGGIAVIDTPTHTQSDKLEVGLNGRILISVPTGSTQKMGILTADGSVDTAYGGGTGFVSVSFPSGTHPWSNALIDGDGKILVAGGSNPGTGSGKDFFVARYMPDGTRDATFDTDGIAYDGGTGSSQAYGLALQTDGKLVVVGYTSQSGLDMQLVRFNADGSLDSSFGNNGIVRKALSLDLDAAYDVKIDANGKIIVAGAADNGGSDFILARFNSDGTLDTSFGAGGGDTLGDTVTYTEGGPAITLDADVAITDAEMSALNGGDGDFGGASVTIERAGGADTEDVFSFDFASGSTLALSGSDITSGGTVIASVTNTGGSLQIGFTDANGTAPTTALVNEIMRAVQYANSSDTPPASADMEWTFSDGTDTGTGTTTVTLVDVPEAPVVTITEDANDDGFINAAESLGVVNVTIDISGTGAVAGDTLTYGDGTNSTDYTLLAGDITAGTVDVNVPAPVDGATVTVSATVTSGGNTGPAGADSAVRDITAPAAPGVTLTNDSGTDGDNITNDPSLTVTSIEAGAQVQYSLDGGTTWVDADPSVTAPNLGADGAKSIDVRQLDAAGNPGATTTLNFELDTIMPAISITTYSAGPVVNAAEETAGFTISGTSSDAVGLFADIVVGGKSYSAEIQPDGSWTITVADGDLTSGDGTINVTAEVDDGVNPVAQDTGSFELDTTMPNAPTVALANDMGTNGDNITGDATLSVTGESGATTEYSLDDSTWGTTASAAAEGANTVYVRSVDAAGNAGPSTQFDFTYYSTAPTPTITVVTDDFGTVTGNVPDGGVTDDGSVTIVGTAVPGTFITLYGKKGAGGWGPGGTTTADANGDWSINLNVAAYGEDTYQLKVTAAWASGQTESAESNVFTATYDATAPTVAGASFGDTLISDSDSGGTLTITFDEDMDQNVDPSVSITANADIALAATGVWTSATTFEIGYTVSDTETEVADVKVDVSGARDVAGNVMVAETDISSGTEVDTLNPATLTPTGVSIAEIVDQDAGAAAPVTLATFSNTDALPSGDALTYSLPSATGKYAHVQLTDDGAGNTRLEIKGDATARAWFDFEDRSVADLTFDITATDDAGNTTTTPFIVTLTDANDAPELGAGPNTFADTLNERADGVAGENDAPFGIDGVFSVHDDDTADTFAIQIQNVSATRTIGGTPSTGQPFLGFFEAGFDDPITGDGDGVVGWNFRVDSGIQGPAAAANMAFIDSLSAGDSVTQVYRVLVQETNGGGEVLEQEVTVTIEGTNDKPVIGAIAATALGEDSASATISVSYDDVDLSDIDQVATISAASVGSGTDNAETALAEQDLIDLISISGEAKAAGATSHSFDVDFNALSGVFDYLSAGESVTVDYTLNIANAGDNATRDFSVTINGSNDGPVIESITPTGGLSEQTDTSNLTATAVVNFTDLDLSDVDQTVTITGASSAGVDNGLTGVTLTDLVTPDNGSNTNTAATGDGAINIDFAAASGVFDYLAVGETVTLTYTVEVSDGDATSATQTFDITITGTNDAPVAIADSATTDEDSTITIDVLANDSDVDNGTTLSIDSFDATADNGGAITEDAGKLVYDPNGAFDYLAVGESATDTFTYTVKDGDGATATETVTITVTGANDAPMLGFVQGFEADTDGVEPNGSTVTTETSGTGGIVTPDGGDYGLFVGPYAFTRFGGYRSEFVDGAITEVDVYLDTSWADGEGLDWSVAAAKQDGSHLQDFIFHVAKDADTGTILVAGSNNTNFTTRTDLDTLPNHYEVNDSGWYTLQHVFRDDGGVLAVDLNLLDGDGNVLFTETRMDPANDIAGSVGGTRYGWLTANNVTGGLAVDNLTLGDFEVRLAEIADNAPTEGNDLTASGVIPFIDVDLTDVHIVSLTNSTSTATGVLGTFTPTISDASTADNEGVVSWTYTVSDADIDYLAAGETVIEVFTVELDDQEGATVSRDITVTLTGTNDGPTIDTSGETDSASETTEEGDGALALAGTLSIADVDVTDTVSTSIHEVSATGTLGSFDASDVGGALKALFGVTGALTGSETSGSAAWTFDAAAGDFDYLAHDEQITITYTVRVTDSEGASADQDVTITVTGTNDRPEITEESGDSAAAGITESLAGDMTGADLVAAGTLTLTDDDASDVPSVSITRGTTTWAQTDDSPVSPNTDIPAATLTALDAALTHAINAGKIEWDFTLDDGLADFLAEGEKLTVEYTLTAGDGNGFDGTTADEDSDAAPQTVTITITGSDDAPSVTATSPAAFAEGDSVLVDGDNTKTGDAAADTVTVHLFEQGTTAGNDVYVTAIEEKDLNDVLSIDNITVTLDGGTTSRAAAHVAAYDAAAVEAAFSIDAGTGEVTFDRNAAIFDSLDSGENIAVTVGYDIVSTTPEGTQTTESRNVTLQVDGANDLPYIVSDVGFANDVTEITDAGPEDEATYEHVIPGSITFNDVDITDTHTVTITATGGTTALADYVGSLSGGNIPIDRGTGTDGTVFYTYRVQNSVIENLTEGESFTQNYRVQISDGTDSFSRDIEITITGTNDAPVISAGPTAALGADTEEADTTDGSATLSASGAIVFTDADTSSLAAATQDADTFTVASAFKSAVYKDSGGVEIATDTATAVGAVTNGAISNNSGTDDGSSSHSFTWGFTVADSAVDFLAAGETLEVSYDFTITDDSGATNDSVVQTVTVTLTGTNDVPSITAATVADPVTEAGGINDADAGTPEVTGDLSAGGNWVDVDNGEQVHLAITEGSANGDAQAALTFDGVTGEAAIAGTYGTLFVQSSGQYRYVLDNTATATKELDGGESVSETFDYTIANNGGGAGNEATSSLTVNITGANDAPVITVGSGDSAAATVEELGVDGNNAPVNPDPTTATGSLTKTDDDADDADTNDIWTVVAQGGDQAQTSATLVTGKYGTLNVDDAGDWTFTLDNADSDVQALHDSESVTETFTVQVADGNGGTDTQDIVITINGTNDAPEITADAGADTDVTEAGEDASGPVAGDTAASGALSMSDVDTGGTETGTWTIQSQNSDNSAGEQAAASGTPATLEGTYGTLTLNADGTWTYALDQSDSDTQALNDGDSANDDFVVRYEDGLGGYDEQTVSIDVTGTNDAPTIASSSSVSGVVEAGGVADTDIGTDEVSGDLSDSANWGDVDDGEAATLAITEGSANGDAQVALTFDGVTGEAAIAGTYGTLFVQDNGQYRYVLDNTATATKELDGGESVSETFDYTIANNGGGAGNAATSSLTVNITGANDAPVISVTGTDADTGTVEEMGVDNANDPVHDAAGDNVVTGTLSRSDDDAGDTDANDTWTVVPDAGQTQTPDGGTGTLANSVTGKYGTLSVDADGAWTFTLDNSDTDVQALHDSESVTETFTVQLADGNGGTDTHDITVTVNGTNDAPTIAVVAGADTEVTEEGSDNGGVVAGDAAASGALTSSDVDTDGGDVTNWSIVNGTVTTAAAGSPAVVAGTYGSLTLNDDGTWSYALDDNATATQALNGGDSETDEFTVRVDDGLGGYSEETVSITVNGSNDGPVAVDDLTTYVAPGDAGNLQVTDEDTVITIDVLANDTDVDAGDDPGNFSLDSVSISGITGGIALEADTTVTIVNDELVFTPGAAFDALDKDDTETVTLSYTMSDDDGVESTATATITIVGTNDAPVLGDVTTTPAVEDTSGDDSFADVTGTVTASDADDSPTLTYTIDGETVSGGETSLVGQYGTLTLDAATGAYTYVVDPAKLQTLNAGDVPGETFTLKVVDEHGASDTAELTVDITPANDAPELADVDAGDLADTDAADDLADITGNLVANDRDAGEGDDGTGVSTGITYGIDGETPVDGATTQTFTYERAASSGVAAATITLGTLTVLEDGTYTFAPDDAGINSLRAGEAPVISTTITATDDGGLSDSATLSIDVTGTNDDPVILNPGIINVEAKEQAEANEGDLIEVGGTIEYDDAELDDAHFFGFTAQGTGYAGSISFTPGDATGPGTGTLGWSFEIADSVVNALAEGEALNTSPQTYTITINDHSGGSVSQQVVINIVGTNDAPVITGAVGEDAGAVTETVADAAITAKGTLNVTDEDTSDTVTISVTDANVTGGTFGGALPLDTAALQAMMQVAAGTDASSGFGATAAGLDADTGAGSDFTWQFTSGAAGNAAFDFLGDGETLEIAYELTATDSTSATTKGTDTQTVTITVTGTNDAPVAAADLTVTADEDAGEADVLATASATDVDATDSIIYTITDGNSSGLFEIDGSTGEISLAAGQALDAETAQQHVLNVTASDGTGSDMQQITIDVNDLDDNPTTAPVDDDAAANEVAENATSGTVGITAQSTDGDITADAPTYAIVGGTGAGIFVIDSGTGVVSVDSGATIDRETTESYTLDVQATTTMPDGGSSSTVTTFTIDVTDVDEFDVTTPVDSDPDANEISETAAAGTAVGITASAADADATSNGITYSLTDDAGGRFVIDASSGIVTLANAGNTPASVDYETDTSHTITVQAQSEDGSTATESFTIQVLNEDDNAPVMTSDVTPDVDENTTNVVTLSAYDPDGNSATVTFSITGGDDALLFDIVGGELVFKAAPDFEMPGDADGDNVYEVEVTSTDEASNATTQTVTVTVNDVNEAPDAVTFANGATTIAENTDLSGSLKVADIVIDDDALGSNTVTLTGADATRFEVLNNAGNLELHFKAGTSPDFEAPDDADTDGIYDVTVEVSDSTVIGSSAVTAGFSLEVTNVNEAPVAYTQPSLVTLGEDTIFSGIIGDDIDIAVFASDVDTVLDAGSLTFTTATVDGVTPAGGDPLTAAGVSYDNVTGAFALNAGAAIYQSLNAGETIDVVVGFTVDDGEFTDTGSITLTVSGTNDLPVVQAASTLTPSGDEDTDITGTIIATDADDGASLSYSVVAADEPTNGSVSIDAGTGAYTYTPDANFNGADAFTVTINDGQGGSITQVVNVTVDAVDDAPVAADGSDSTDEDTAQIIDVAGLITEVDGDSYTVTASVDPAEGTITGINGTEISFDPAANFNGTVTITYTVTDDTTGMLADSGDVTVTVNAVDDAPVAADNTASTDEDTATIIDVASLITEVDGDATTVTASVDAAEGTVSVSGTEITFTPAANFNGDATITYTVTDTTGAALNDSGDITVTVNPVNDPTEIDTSAQVDVTHVEAVDAAPLAPTAVAADVVIEDVDGLDYDTGTFTASVVGGDATDMLALDGAATLAGSDVMVGGTVIGTASGVETGTLSVTFNADADAADVQAVIQSLNYATTSDTPVASRTIMLDLTDGDGAAATQQSVTVDITAMNDSPVATDDAISVAEGAFSNVHNVLTIGTPDSDPESDALSVTQIADIDDVLPVGGTLETASVPVSGAGVITTDWGAEVTMQANGLLSYNLTSGTAKFNELKAGQTAIDSFSYTISDGNGGTDTATVEVTITGTNDQIQATADIIAATEGDGGAVTAHTLNGGAVGSLLANDMDVDVGDTREIINVGNSVTATAVATAGGFLITLASGATIDLNTDGTYSITAPDSMPEGVQTASFSYTVQDGGSAQSTTTVTVNITGTNDAPVATVVTLDAIDEDTSVTIEQADLLGGVSDVDSTSLTITDLQITAGDGTLVDNGDGTWTYTPAANDDGSVTFAYTASDGTLTATSTAELDLLPVNDPAVIAGDVSGDVTEDDITDTATGTLSITDADTGEAALQAVAAGTAGDSGYGTFEVLANGDWTYTLDNGNGDVQALPDGATLIDTITVTSVDGTATEMLTVTITGANDAAVIAGDVSGTLTEDQAGGVSQTAGTLSITDVDTGEASFVATTAPMTSAGGYGTFEVSAAGEWTFEVDASNPAILALNDGDSLSDSFEVEALDGTTQTVSVTIDGANNLVLGDEGDNALTGGPGMDTVSGLGGDDTLTGSAGDDTMLGGDGDDRLVYGDGFDSWDGGAGTDWADFSSFVSGVWVDLQAPGTEAWTKDNGNVNAAGIWREIAGLSNIENVIGTDGVDYFAGDDQDNVYVYHGTAANVSSEIINGRGGSDTVDFSNFGSAVWINLGQVQNAWTLDSDDATDPSTGAWRRLAQMSGVENFIGTEGVDYMAGNAADNHFTYVGSAAITGIEKIFGLGGSDTVDFSGFGSSIWVDLEQIGRTVWTRDSDDQSDAGSGAWRTIAKLEGIENVSGTMGIDHLAGDANDNHFTYVGSSDIAGQDQIDGRGGIDTIDFSRFESAVWVDLGNPATAWTRDTESHSDSSAAWRRIANASNVENTVGTDFDDYLKGDANDNAITGGAGDDDLYGGGGSDTFVFATGSGSDIVHDFEDGSDLLDVSGWGQSFAELTITDDGTDSTVSNGVDEVTLLDVTGLTTDDFIF